MPPPIARSRPECRGSWLPRATIRACSSSSPAAESTAHRRNPMARKPHPARIGAFVIGSIVLAVVAVMIWGSGALFERKYEYVCYFPYSVSGLSKGAPVKYRGVEVGVVKDIKVRFRQELDDE